MAELHDLSPTPGSRKNRKRVGRGPGSGRGKTSTRGQKGQKARSGGSVRPSFEGGQMPLVRRIPKRGFKSLSHVEYQVVNVRDLERLDGEVSLEALAGAGLIRSTHRPVKVLGEGELAKALSVSAHAFSAGARSKIEAAGGSVNVIGRASTESTEE
jgi:large subunit ribosomal protein L15